MFIRTRVHTRTSKYVNTYCTNAYVRIKYEFVTVLYEYVLIPVHKYGTSYRMYEYTVQEVLITSKGERFPVLLLNIQHITNCLDGTTIEIKI